MKKFVVSFPKYVNVTYISILDDYLWMSMNWGLFIGIVDLVPKGGHKCQGSYYIDWQLTEQIDQIYTLYKTSKNDSC